MSIIRQSQDHRVRSRLRRRVLGVRWEQMIFGHDDIGGFFAEFVTVPDLWSCLSLSRACARVISPLLRLRQTSHEQDRKANQPLYAHQHLFLAIGIAAIRIYAGQADQVDLSSQMKSIQNLTQVQKQKDHQKYVRRQRATQPQSQKVKLFSSVHNRPKTVKR